VTEALQLGVLPLEQTSPSQIARAANELVVNQRNIKGRPLWSRVLSVRLKPLQRGTPYD